MEWRDVVGFEGKYIVSEHGHIKRLPLVFFGVDHHGKSVTKRKPEYEPIIRKNKKGYKCVALCTGDGRHKTIVIHRIVAEAFLSLFKKELTIDHLDCNKENNHYSNLEAVSNYENLKRSHKYGTHSRYIPKVKRRVLTADQVLKIRETYKLNQHSQRDLAKVFGVSQDTIKRVINKSGHYAGI